MVKNTRAVGVIGLGVMGSSIAKNLAKRGHRVLGYSRANAKAEALAPFEVEPASLHDVTKQCDTILLSLVDGASVESVLFGSSTSENAGLVSTLREGTLIIDTTTIAPSEAVSIAARVAARGGQMIDAPVTGGDVGARDGTLTIMCGGTEASFAAALPILECMGSKIVHVGPSGMGQRMKAINQIGVALGIVAMTEALVCAEAQGIDAEVALDILQGGAAGSWALSHYAPRLLKGDLKPGFRAEHMLKDLRIALRDVESECELPGVELAAKLFEKLVASTEGLGNHALKKVYEPSRGVGRSN